MNFLETVFGELGITQYLGVFIDQGFDSWETILDITESDLDALGVKLGHRRKLQRRIANYRGVAPDASLVSPTRTSIEDARHDSNRADADRTDAKTGPVVVKRKYRRHPKPDEHAPERPPSAYVLFSNKMREDLKGQNLTFTEIAKLVGENWQSLGRTEKEPFEKQANDAKEKYNQALSEYKKTPECKKYNEYLHEFRKRQATHSHEKDAAKRLKTDAESTRGSSTSGGSIGPGATTSGTGSGSESQHGSEPPPSRQQRLGSIASMSTSTNHIDGQTSPSMLSHEEAHHGRRRGLSSPHSRNGSIHSVNQRMGWDGQYLPTDVTSNGAPWLESRTAPPMISQSPEVGIPSIHSAHAFHAGGPSRSSRSSGSTNSQTPSLKHEQSSYGSNSSTSPYPPRTPSDASLPIHALLSSKPESPAPTYTQVNPLHSLNGHMSQASLPLQQTPKQQHQPSRIAGGFHHASHYNNSPSGHMSGPGPTRPPGPAGLVHEAATNPPRDPSSSAMIRPPGIGDTGLDGISALLRAREIVDRRP